jgi:hypothetical protein
MPIPKTRPAMVIRLRVRPAKYISIIVITTETGMLIPIISVGFMERRNKKRTKTARSAPQTAVFITCLSEFSIISVVLKSSVIFTSGGS